MNLTIRLVLLAILAASPGVALQVWNYVDLDRARTEGIKAQVLQLATSAGEEIDRIADGARQFLVALAQVPQLRSADPVQCTELLTQIRENYRSYRALIVADAVGRVICSSVGPGPAITDRTYFRRAIERNDFASGEYVHGRGTRAPVFHFAYSIRDQSGEPAGVIAAALDLGWLTQQLESRLRPGMILLVTDRNGTILSRLPADEDWRGQAAPPPFLAALRTSRPQTLDLVDGNKRYVFATTQVGTEETGIHIGLGWDRELAFADLRRTSERSAILIALGLFASIVLALFWGMRGIAVPLNRLLHLVERWRRGDYASSGQAWDRSELGRLGSAFDALSQTVQEREEELHRSRTELAERERYLTAVLDRIPTGIMQVDAAGCYVFVNRYFCRIVDRHEKELLGRPFTDFTHPDDVQKNLELFSSAIHSRQPYRLRKRYVRGDGSAVWIEITAAPFAADSPDLLTVATDLTDRVQAEEQQALLMRELDHRVKNTLATVQSLAMLTKRHAGSPQEFYRSFSERLVALSATHNLLAETAWRGAALYDVIISELSPYGASDPSRLVVQGPEIRLAPSAAISTGLLFHELATNAAKYGALRGSSGALRVHWTADDRQVLIKWEEAGVFNLVQADRRGFGSHLIEQTVQMLGGKFDLELSPPGLRCTISLPLSTISYDMDEQRSAPQRLTGATSAARA